MAELTTIARPYAKAAFHYALEKSLLAQWSNSLRSLALIASDVAIKAVLLNPQLTAEQKVEFFISVSDEKIDDDLKNLLMQLALNKRLETLPAIYVLFEILVAEQNKTIDVNVSSAFALNDAELESLIASLKKRLGRDVKLDSVVDKNLIGGVLIHAGDLVIDASVKGKLAKLANELNT